MKNSGFYKFFLICSLLIINAETFLFTTSVKIIDNNLEEINRCSGKLNLSLIKEWGNENSEKQEDYFLFPTDLKIYKNNVYIVSSNEHKVKVFNRKGFFIKSIGVKGKGPGDMLHPSLISFGGNFSIVLDDSNYRIQIFNNGFKYKNSFKTKKSITGISVFKNEIALVSKYFSLKQKKLLFLYNTDGEEIGSIGDYIDFGKTIQDSNSIMFAIKSHVIVCYRSLPIFLKYTSLGTLQQIIRFQVPFHTPKVILKKNKLIVEGKYKKKMIGKIPIKMAQVIAGVTIDKKENVYLVVANRRKKREDIFYVTGDKIYPKNFVSESTDRFMLLVFNKHGKVIAKKKLNIRCDKIYIHNNSLFVIDTYIGNKIYEYKIEKLFN